MQIATPPKGVPAIVTVAERRWDDGKAVYQYRLTDDDGNIYSEKEGKEEIDWFAEGRLTLA